MPIVRRSRRLLCLAIAMCSSGRVAGFQGHELELTADIFNLPNFLDRDWGRKYKTGDDGGGVLGGSRLPLLELVGYDDANGRGVYNLIPPRVRGLDVDATRWQVQLSARYTF